MMDELPEEWPKYLKKRFKVGEIVKPEKDSEDESHNENPDDSFDLDQSVELLPLFSALQINEIKLTKACIFDELWEEAFPPTGQ